MFVIIPIRRIPVADANQGCHPMDKTDLTKEIAKVLANNGGETVLNDDDLRCIEALFRVWQRECLCVKSLLVLEYKIQAFLGSDRGWKLSEERRDLFKEVTDMIDCVEATGWYCEALCDVVFVFMLLCLCVPVCEWL
ncbi:hypothetical protein GPU96_08g14420 [Encephalitozoon hellem]|uniref:Uncharacterized protein n=1 Tax=Encephalitozoon hellem TaxID=27973 RepID=A0A9Q9F8I2_ENCHE|nr:hypothetical protein GPU96_08g14420 [Encephalitozoon hellem]